MSGQSAVAVGALLAALFLVLVALMVWQEARRRTAAGPPVYSIDDAVPFSLAALPGDAADRLGAAGVRRILEWEVYYLQGLAEGRRGEGVTVVAGGSEPAVSFIAEQIAERHGVTYEREDIRAVLAGEAGYLASIGAVGEPVEVQE